MGFVNPISDYKSLGRRSMARLAIIAGQGNLPLQVAESASMKGFDIVVFPIEGQADAFFSRFVVQIIRLGAIGQIQSYLNKYDCKNVVMVGKVVWPSLSALQPDAVGKNLLRNLVTRGDDSVLRAISDYFSENGVETLPISMFISDRVMPFGHLAGPTLNSEDTNLIKVATNILSILGKSDVGQSVVVQNGRVLAIEAAEGTSAMIRRSSDLIDRNGGRAAFLKMQKSGQDNRLDTPVIGVKTLEAVFSAGIKILAIEANKVLLADDSKILSDLCDKNRVTFIGISKVKST